MMGRSHVAIGTVCYGLAIGADLLPMTAATFGAVAIGSLAPDIDHPQATLGRVVPFISVPLYAWIGHRTATHSTYAVLAIGGVSLIISLARPDLANLAMAFVLGYILHIAADLLTVEGCALAYPSRTRFSLWPRVKTGGVAELVLATFITLAATLTLTAWQPQSLAGPMKTIAPLVQSFKLRTGI